MKATEAMQHIIKGSPMSQNALGAVLGLGWSGMSGKVRRLDSVLSFVCAALAACGYDLVAVPRGSRLPQGSVPIEADPFVPQPTGREA